MRRAVAVADPSQVAVRSFLDPRPADRVTALIPLSVGEPRVDARPLCDPALRRRAEPRRDPVGRERSPATIVATRPTLDARVHQLTPRTKRAHRKAVALVIADGNELVAAHHEDIGVVVAGYSALGAAADLRHVDAPPQAERPLAAARVVAEHRRRLEPAGPTHRQRDRQRRGPGGGRHRKGLTDAAQVTATAGRRDLGQRAMGWWDHCSLEPARGECDRPLATSRQREQERRQHPSMRRSADSLPMGPRTWRTPADSSPAAALRARGRGSAATTARG